MHPYARWRFCAIVALFAFVPAYFRREQYIVAAEVSKVKREKVGLCDMLFLFTTKNSYAQTLEEICLKAGTCMEVRDVLEKTKNKCRSRREIISKNLELSSIGLIPPEDITLNDLDTREWEMDKGAHSFKKLAMIEEMFLSGALDMDKETEARVVLLGSSGGSLSSYLRYHFPKMDITIVEVDQKMVDVAKKWFGLTLDRRQHLIIQDVYEFINRAIEQGKAYDIILMDACSKAKAVLCPLKSAIDLNTVEALSSILYDNGALIVNVFSMPSDASVVANEVKSQYERVFDNCYLRNSQNDRLVITCTNHARPKGLEELYSSFIGYEEPDVVLI